MNTTLKSNAAKAFLAKVWGPILLVAAAVGVFGRDFPHRLPLMMVPLLVAAIFGASAATLRVYNGDLQYRRLLTWKTIRRDEVLGVSIFWAPVLGSIRLTRTVYPWGRLYFILDGSTYHLFQKPEYRLPSFIRSYKTLGSHNKS